MRFLILEGKIKQIIFFQKELKLIVDILISNLVAGEMKHKLSQTIQNCLHQKFKAIMSKRTIKQCHQTTSDSVATIVSWAGGEEEEVEKLITKAYDLKVIGNSKDLFNKLKS